MFVHNWVQFWFTPSSPIGLHWLRVLAGVCFLSWLLPFAGNLDALFGIQGWFDVGAYQEAVRMPEGPPPISWSLLYLCGSNSTLLATAYWLSLGVIALFTLGIATRVTSILTWAIVVSFTANPAMIDDAEALLPVLAFYVMVGYVLIGPWGKYQSWLTRLFGSTKFSLLSSLFRRNEDAPEPSLAANVAVRLLQVHFAIAILISGLHKLQFGDWWAGAALWYPLHPPFRATIEEMRAHAAHPIAYLTMLSLATYSVLAWEITFPLFAWRRRLRAVLLVGGVVAWIGAASIYELPMMGPVILIGCFSYLTTAEWQRVTGWLATIVGMLRLSRDRSEVRSDEVIKSGAKRQTAAAPVASGRRP
jgi:hypothetical protein